MKSDTLERGREKWLIFNSLGLLLIFAGSIFACIAPYQWDQFYTFWYMLLGASLITCYICFGIKNCKKEVKLLAAFSIWLVISRVLNGDLFLFQDGRVVLDITLSSFFVTAALILPPDKRKKLIDAFAIVTTVLCLLGSVLGLYTVVTGKLLPNPLTEWYLCTVLGNRLEMFDASPNVCGNWLFCGIMFLVYLFFRYKNPAVRVLTVIAAVTEYTALAMTASRSSMLGLAVSIAMLVAALLFKGLKIKKTGYKALTLVLSLIIAGPLCYAGFSGVRSIVGDANLSYSIKNGIGDAYWLCKKSEPVYMAENLSCRVMLSADQPESGEEVSEGTDSIENEMEGIFEDDRGFEDSGRLNIYKTAIMSLKDDPARILRGCLNGDIMSIANSYFEREYGHMHNSYVQVLHFAGLPGLIIVIAFTVLLLIDSVKLYFSESVKADMAVKTLVLFLPGMFIYNMLETSVFAFLDMRSMVLFLAAGAVIAYSYELCPPGVKKHK